MPTLLIADDEPAVLKVLARFLARDRRRLLLAGSVAEALALAREQGPVDVALLDKNLADGSGLDVARELKRQDEDVQVLLLTAYASLRSAVEAVQIGAYDYLTKPVEDFDALELRISNALEKVRLAREHRRTVAALVESERRNRQLLEAMPDGLVAYDPADGRIHAANAAAARLLGAAPDALAGRDVGALFDGGRAPGDAIDDAPVRCVRIDGTSFPAEVREGSLAWQGRTLRALVVRDVSRREALAAERRAAEEQLRHAQKLDAVARLAGGIGHDLGNMLGVVLTYLDVLEGRAPAEDLAAMRVAADRAAGLVRQMMALARRAPARPVRVALQGAVTELARLLARTLGERIGLELRLSPEPCPVEIDPGQLSQVLLNLAVNARDAMPEGGRLTVGVERLPGPGHGLAALVVEDTGTGMTPEVRARMFEPFFTTKAEGRGTGLGLAVTQGIVAQAAGRIEVESEPGRGSTFRIVFPLAPDAPERPPSPALPAAPRPGGRARVLLVDDEPILRGAAAAVLRDSGFAVEVAGSAEEALSLLPAIGPVDLLVTDVVMPGRSGPELAADLRRGQPGARVLLITGVPGDPRVLAAARDGAAVLEKPFGAKDLADRVRALLASPPEGPAADGLAGVRRHG
jgi:PAS domain S-box-containing protein